MCLTTVERNILYMTKATFSKKSKVVGSTTPAFQGLALKHRHLNNMIFPQKQPHSWRNIIKIQNTNPCVIQATVSLQRCPKLLGKLNIHMQKTPTWFVSLTQYRNEFKICHRNNYRPQSSETANKKQKGNSEMDWSKQQCLNLSRRLRPILTLGNIKLNSFYNTKNKGKFYEMVKIICQLFTWQRVNIQNKEKILKYYDKTPSKSI